jgi:hypothetical protein
MMNLYLINSKARLIKQARADLMRIYGINHTPFSRKLFFYFFVHNNKKYVHKESLRFVYSNADTYTKETEPLQCNLQKDFEPLDPFPFLESYRGELLPALVDSNDAFLVYDFFEGDPAEDLSKEEFYWLENQHVKTELTPFYNSMTYNIVRSDQQIKVVDFKHFEPKDAKPFFIYLYNEQNSVNTLYIKEGTDTRSIISHLSIDYPVLDAIIIEY